MFIQNIRVSYVWDSRVKYDHHCRSKKWPMKNNLDVAERNVINAPIDLNDDKINFIIRTLFP